MEWEDYYEILGVGPDSSAEEIKEAYRYKANILHPDRLMGAPESVRCRAEEELKRVNRAYEILGDAPKRQQYHAEWIRQRAEKKGALAPPKPVVDPLKIRFGDVEQGETKRASFIIRNAGGPYGRIWISNPDSWVRVVGWASLTTSDELPLEVEIEAEGEEWGKSYLEYIKVKLDDEETQVRMELQTRPEPAREKEAPSGIPTAVPSPSRASPNPEVSPLRKIALHITGTAPLLLLSPLLFSSYNTEYESLFMVVYILNGIVPAIWFELKKAGGFFWGGLFGLALSAVAALIIFFWYCRDVIWKGDYSRSP